MKTRLSKVVAGILAAIYLATMALSGVAFATPQQTSTLQVPSGQQGPKRGVNPETGRVSFIGAGDPINVPSTGTTRSVTLQGRAMDTLTAYGAEFGLKNPSQELKLLKSEKDDNGNDIVQYQQVYNGVPILAGEMIVNMNANGQLLSVSGEVSSGLTLDTNPVLLAKEAEKTALAEIARIHQIDPAQLTASNPELWIFDESLLKSSTRPTELVWRMEVRAKDVAQPVRELVLVNAQTGKLSLHINQIDTEFTSSQTILKSGAMAPLAASSTIQYADLVVDEARGKLYGADKAGNKIDIINMTDLSVTGSYTLAAGALPTGIDLRPDGNELAVAQSGLDQVKFINLTNGTLSQLASPLQGGPNGEPSLVTDVIYGRSGILYAFSNHGLHVVNVAATPHAEVLAQYVPEEVSFHDDRFGAISSDKNTLYYVAGSTWSVQNLIFKFNVSAGVTGPTLLGKAHIMGTQSKTGFRPSLIDDATLLITSGNVYNTSDLTSKAKNGQASSPALGLPGRNFYVTAYDNPAGTDLLYFFDKQNSYLTSILNTGASGTPGALAVTGNGSTLFVSSTGGMTKFTLGTTPPGTAVAAPETTRQYMDFAFDMARGVIYGTDYSNRVDVINQSTGAIVNSYLLPNGAAPQGIDLSPSGNELAIALSGLEKILFINPTTGARIAEVTPQFPPISDDMYYDNVPFDVIYGRAGRLYSDGNAANRDYMHIIDTTTHTWIGRFGFQDGSTNRAELAITSDKRYLYADDSGSTAIHGFDVQTDTVTQAYQSPASLEDAISFTIAPDGTKVFTSYGRVLSGNLQTVLGTLAGAPGYFGLSIKYIPAKNAVVYTSADPLTGIETTTITFASTVDYHQISTYTLPPDGYVREMEVAPDGSRMILNYSNGTPTGKILIINFSTFPPPQPPPPTPVPTVTPNPGDLGGVRRTYTASGSLMLPGALLCTQSQVSCTNGADPDADNAHRFAADTFAFYKTHHGRNSFDDNGGTIISTVRYDVGYQNAFWDGTQMVYGDGMAADDIVGHELTHAVTQYSSDLLYANQSGAINESFSDLWGEFIDQTNGAGNDSAAVKWLLGEDSALGVTRSMSDPTVYGQPDKMSSPYFYTGPNDNGGVHINSGVNNKAVYLMVEGGSFNGRTITGIGLNKTAAVYYEAQRHLLFMGSNYNDLYYALLQACQNLIGGADGITQNDCNQVKAAAEAVEMLPPPVTPTNTPTVTSTPPYSYNPLYLSLASSQTIGGVSSANEDILKFDGTNWSLYFDGTDVGLGSVNLIAFHIVNANTILMAFNANVTVNGITATPHDILRFDATSLGSNTAGTFSLYFQGSDVGLTTTSEKIDALSLLPDGRLLISTNGNPSVPGVTSAQDEDVLAFTPTSLGSTTSGTWSLYFNGTGVGLGDTSGEDVDGVDVSGNNIYLSTVDNFSVPGLSGADEDVFVCAATSLGNVTACNYSPTLYFDGSTWGLSANDVDAFNLPGSGPAPTVVPTSTATGIPTRTPTTAPGATNTPTRTATATPSPTATAGSGSTPTRTPTATATSAAGSTFTFTPVADTYVNAGSAATNYGTSTSLRADASPDVHSYLRFNVQGLNGTLKSATILVYANSSSSAGISVNSVSDNTWSETTLNYNNAPPVGGLLGSVGGFTAPIWIRIDVTGYVTGNGTYNFALTTPGSTAISFASREAGANAPQLIIETTP